MHESPTKTSRSRANLMTREITAHGGKIRDTPTGIFIHFSKRGSHLGQHVLLRTWWAGLRLFSEFTVV